MEKSKVLIVEDDNLTRNFLSEIILSFGYDVESCNNGEEAIVQIKDFEPNVILSDILMPEFSGLQLLNFVQKKISRDIPILLISSLEYSSLEEMVNEIGATGFISKPPTKEILKEELEFAING